MSELRELTGGGAAEHSDLRALIGEGEVEHV
jgi:hypothetical protein